MYKSKNIQEHNLQQYYKAKKFLQGKNITQIELLSDDDDDQILFEAIREIQTNQSIAKQQNQSVPISKCGKYLPKIQNSFQQDYTCNILTSNQKKFESIKKNNYESNQISKKIANKIKSPTGKLAIRNYKLADQRQWEDKDGIVSDETLFRVMQKFPNITKFKNNQKAIIKCSLAGEDVFVCMPTGGGKSLTFQMQTFLQEGIYLCVLPLVSLIMDQEEQAKKVQIQAYSLTAGTSYSDMRYIYNRIQQYSRGNPSIVIFCTPEKVNLSQNFLQILLNIYKRGDLVKIVIDQVHCVSTWGKEFRKQYQNLWVLKDQFPKTPILALTATVTQVIKQDIISRLKIKNCYYFQSSFNRPNLFYQVVPKTKNVVDDIIKICKRRQGQSGIIYCLSKKSCEEMCQSLRKIGLKVGYYHAGVNESERRQIQQLWMKGKIHIIVATIAFGMGINKPNVRFVIHHTLSKSLQNYYQESGRAGRDGLDAFCTIFYRNSDKIALQSLTLKNQYSSMQNKDFCSKQLSQMIRYCQDKLTCRRQFQLGYLGQIFDPALCHKTCDNCQANRNYIQFQCIEQAKTIVKTMIILNQSYSLTLKQLVELCKKGRHQKKQSTRLQQLISVQSLHYLAKLFMSWSAIEIQMLILELINLEILIQSVVLMQIQRFQGKNDNQPNLTKIQIKCNLVRAKNFMNQESFLIRKEVKRKIIQVETEEEDEKLLDEYQQITKFEYHPQAIDQQQARIRSIMDQLCDQ